MASGLWISNENKILAATFLEGEGEIQALRKSNLAYTPLIFRLLQKVTWEITYKIGFSFIPVLPYPCPSRRWQITWRVSIWRATNTAPVIGGAKRFLTIQLFLSDQWRRQMIKENYAEIVVPRSQQQNSCGERWGKKSHLCYVFMALLLTCSVIMVCILRPQSSKQPSA